MGILQRAVLLYLALGIGLIGPGGLVIGFTLQSGKDAVVVAGEFECRIDQETGVGVIFHILFLDQIVVQDVLDHPAQKGDVRPRPEGGVDMGLGGGLRKPRVNADERCPLFHGLGYPLEGYGVIGGRVAAHNQNAITVLKIDPVIRHGAASERLCQSRYSSAVSDTGLVLDIDQTQPPQEFLVEKAFFIVQGGASHRGDTLGAVDRLPLVVDQPEAFIPAFFDVSGYLIQRPFPGYLFPLAFIGRAIKGLRAGDSDWRCSSGKEHCLCCIRRRR